MVIPLKTKQFILQILLIMCGMMIIVMNQFYFMMIQCTDGFSYKFFGQDVFFKEPHEDIVIDKISYK